MYFITIKNHQHELSFKFYGKNKEQEALDFINAEVPLNNWGYKDYDKYLFKVDGENFDYNMPHDYNDEIELIRTIINSINCSDFNVNDYKDSILDEDELRSKLKIDINKFIDLFLNAEKDKKDNYILVYCSDFKPLVFLEDKRLNYIGALYSLYLHRAFLVPNNDLEEGKLLSLISSDLLEVVDIALKNKIKLDEFEFKYKNVNATNFQERINFFNELQPLIERKFIHFLEYCALTNFEFDNFNIEKAKYSIEKYYYMDSKDKIKTLKNLPRHLLIQLYEEGDFYYLRNYALHHVSNIKEAKIVGTYYDGCYYKAIEIDVESLEKLKNNKLIPLYFNKGEIGRGPLLSDEDKEKTLLYIECAYDLMTEYERLILIKADNSYDL